MATPKHIPTAAELQAESVVQNNEKRNPHFYSATEASSTKTRVVRKGSGTFALIKAAIVKNKLKPDHKLFDADFAEVFNQEDYEKDVRAWEKWDLIRNGDDHAAKLEATIAKAMEALNNLNALRNAE